MPPRMPRAAFSTTGATRFSAALTAVRVMSEIGSLPSSLSGHIFRNRIKLADRRGDFFRRSDGIFNGINDRLDYFNRFVDD